MQCLYSRLLLLQQRNLSLGEYLNINLEETSNSF
nr:MAG TPA: hypothetical protein [Caudoviricetes sp.]DAK94609.1 MAG TPA: hypothetical protein [Caudoviricetes sp.]